MSAPVSDLYGVFDRLDPREQRTLEGLRAVLERDLAPQLAGAWERAELPPSLYAPLIGLDLMAPPALGGDEPSALYEGYRSFELARVDASLATFYNAVAGLFRTLVRLGASPAQRAAWDPEIAAWRFTGVFALTEPEHGSDIARGIATTCRRDGAGWVVDGAKRWIGGAGQVQKIAVFARDVTEGADARAVRCLLVDAGAPGLTLSPITGKASLRIMQNYDLRLEGVRVADEGRLGGISTFADVANVLRATRSMVAWMASGAAAGAYEAALRYTTRREQFGHPIAGFQLVQEKLARMLANVTASLALVSNLTERQTAGVLRDEDSALAKMFTAERLRETAALAREVCGGNGITLDADVARFHADAEAIYSYEGTHEINALIVGRAATGLSAFTRR
jgi:glutaryl-CoA dehydrogenase